MRNRQLLMVLLAVLMVSTAMAQVDSPPNYRCSEHGTVTDRASYAGYTVRNYRGDYDGWGGCIEVLNQGRIEFKMFAGGRFEIGNDLSESEIEPSIPMGKDITGLGKPNLILGEYSGGAHCCWTIHVLELGASVRKVASLEAGNSEDVHFEDVDHDGKYEFIARDETFVYWHSAFVDSAAPDIVLRFNGTGYELALDLMRKPAPSRKELQKLAADVRSIQWGQWCGYDGYPPSPLWHTMLAMIYTGHSELAWKFVPMAWKSAPRLVSQQEFLKHFCGRLAQSPYFHTLRPTIKNAPCEFDPKFD